MSAPEPGPRPVRILRLGPDAAAFYLTCALAVLCALFVIRTSLRADELQRRLDTTTEICRREP